MFKTPKNVEEFIAENLDQSSIDQFTEETSKESITPSTEGTIKKRQLKR